MFHVSLHPGLMQSLIGRVGPDETDATKEVRAATFIRVTHTPALTVDNGVQVPNSIHLLVQVDQDLVDVSSSHTESSGSGG